MIICALTVRDKLYTYYSNTRFVPMQFVPHNNIFYHFFLKTAITCFKARRFFFFEKENVFVCLFLFVCLLISLSLFFCFVLFCACIFILFYLLFFFLLGCVFGFAYSLRYEAYGTGEINYLWKGNIECRHGKWNFVYWKSEHDRVKLMQ